MDLNSDLGEGFGPWPMGADAALLELVTSANVACGFHAGDPSIMRRTLTDATRNGVAVGAHVSYPDRRGFGRYDMDLPRQQISDDVIYQIGALDALARACGTRVSYVKAHGALYNRMAVDRATAQAVIDAITAIDPTLPLLTMPNCVAAQLAERAGLNVVAEGFADRAYYRDGQLVPRAHAGALLTDPETVAHRALRMAVAGTVMTIDGAELTLPVRSLCVHGDSPGAVVLTNRIRDVLQREGVPLAPFVAR